MRALSGFQPLSTACYVCLNKWPSQNLSNHALEKLNNGHSKNETILKFICFIFIFLFQELGAFAIKEMVQWSWHSVSSLFKIFARLIPSISNWMKVWYGDEWCNLFILCPLKIKTELKPICFCTFVWQCHYLQPSKQFWAVEACTVMW